MLPKSRGVQRGAHRLVTPSYINKEVNDGMSGLGAGNNISLDRVSIVSASIGEWNNLSISKRRVALKSPPREFVAYLNISCDNRNKGEIRLNSDTLEDYTVNISIGSENTLDVSLADQDDFAVGNNNIIMGHFDTLGTDVTVRDNNLLIDFTSTIKRGTAVRGLSKDWSLKVSTKVSGYTGVAQEYIEVEDVTNISMGNEISFGSIAAAFVRKIVVGVSGNKVYFSEPLTAKEATFPGAEVFTEFYEVLPEFEANVVGFTPARSKRLIIDAPSNGGLYLRDVTIGGDFSTKALFQRESDGLVIIRDLTERDIGDGEPFYAEEYNPYRGWTATGEIDPDNPRRFLLTNENLAFIGRVPTNADSIRIVGFGVGYIEFDNDIPAGEVVLEFAEVDSSPAGGVAHTVTSAPSSMASTTIPVEDTSQFFIGQKIEIAGVAGTAVVEAITANTIEIDRPHLPQEIDNMFFVGTYQMEKDPYAARSRIQSAAQDLHQYIFGGGE
jgi:hypothetical protein